MGRWKQDFQEKTTGMNRQQKLEYIAEYYWPHILGVCIVAGLLVLLVYHVTLGRDRTVFHCVMVNQEVDYERDERIQKEFADYLGVDPKEIGVDSGFGIAYEGNELEGVNRSSYEKFFFNWSVHELDIVIMPESFYEHCLEQDGAFSYVTVLDSQKFMQKANLQEPVNADGRTERLILAIPADSGQQKLAKAFLDYAEIEEIPN